LVSKCTPASSPKTKAFPRSTCTKPRTCLWLWKSNVLRERAKGQAC
jgi:hypothetical protein